MFLRRGTSGTIVDVVLPWLDEAAALPVVLRAMPAGFRPVVVDNGCTDDSPANRPEIVGLLRGDEGRPYWLTVLAYCLDGNLQAVLDEYLHVLVESEGLGDVTAAARADALCSVVASALSVHTVNNEVDDIRMTDEGIAIDRHMMRGHFAVRFGRSQVEDAKVVVRESDVRTAFNSPFWPFVLASTSVGKEGLDFHHYSHAVVHWNLPSNPVDLDQREGRVHRYKGHAIRKNVAQLHRTDALGADDPWAAMFAAAVAGREPDDSDLTPFWIFASRNGARIERYVPALPLSKEAQRYRRLLRSVGAYRLVIGQPRQEDLLHYIGADTAREASWLRLNLTPH